MNLVGPVGIGLAVRIRPAEWLAPDSDAVRESCFDAATRPLDRETG
jgi:hypothetical protein